MTAKVLSLYILTILLLAAPPFGECAPSAQTAATAETTASAQQPAADAQPTAVTEATAEPLLQTETTAQTDLYREARPADWAFVLRDSGSATYLRMDTIRRAEEARGTVLYGDLKKVYTKHGLLHVYYSIKNSHESDEESLAILKQIDHSILHVSYMTDASGIFHRLHSVTFYNKSGNPLETFDFDDIARQTDTDIEWQEVTRQMTEERAIFYRLANG